MNKVCETGRLTTDIELKQTPTGVSVCSFGIAVKRPNTKDTTDFFNCVAWRNTAEFISTYFKKGQKIEITGILTSRQYETRDNQKRTVIEIVVETAEFAESKKAEAETDPEQQEKPAPTFQEVIDDDLPF